MSAEQVRSELRSRPGQADFLSLAETLSSLIALIQDGKLVYVNKAACTLLGRSKEQAIGRQFHEVIHPEDREAAIARAQARMAGIPQPKRLIERLVHADGHAIYMDYSIDVIQFEGRPTILVTGYDVTERMKAQEAHRHSEERFRLSFTHAAIGKAIIAPDRRIVEVNPAACRMLGYSEAELQSLSTADVTHPDDVARTEQMVRRLLEGPDVSAALEKRFRHKDGHIVWGLLTATLVREPGGKPLYFIAEIEDITERKKAAQALKESEERFRNLFMQAPVMLMAFDPAGRVRDVSNFWLQTMGYDREEIIGREAWHLITPEAQDRLRRAIEENERNRESVLRNLTLRAIRKDGTTIDLLCTSVAEISDSGESKGSICVEINLTDLQRAEAALRESEERYRALVEHAPEAIMVLDVETDRFVDANPPAEKLFGYPRAKLLTMGPLDFCPEHQADRRRSSEVVEDEHRKVLEGATPVFEFTHVTADGRRIECQTRLSRLPAAGRKLIRVTVTDISELKQLQEKVRHAEKLAAVGVLAAGVAHEIGNPLMALSQAAQSLERRSCDDYAKMKLALIGEHIDRISRIVRQMSNLARPQNGHRRSCDLNEIVRRSVDMVRYDKRSRNSEIRYELAESLPVVEVVEDELTQVCINLALNAFDAMADNAPDRPRRLTIRSGIQGSTVRISFCDTGHGVSLENRSKLFQPFFTTKEAGHGTGLGLSVSFRILQEHQGNLRLEDDGSPGAVFIVELPVGGRP